VESRILSAIVYLWGNKRLSPGAKNIYFSVGMMPAPLSKRGCRVPVVCGFGHWTPRTKAKRCRSKLTNPWGKLCLILLSVDLRVVAIAS
jgi:hypothetical protein